MGANQAVLWGDMDAAWAGLAVGALAFGFLWLWAWHRRTRSTLQAEGPLWDQMDARRGGVIAARGILLVLAGGFMVAGLMRPQFGSRATELKNLGIDVAIALDASKSMKVTDIVPDRLQAAKLEIRRLMGGLHGGRVALVPFAGLAFIQTPLTADSQVVETYLDALSVEDMPRGGTAVGRAIIEGIRALMPAAALRGTAAEDRATADAVEASELSPFEGSKNKALILFTDGEDHEGDPMAAAELAAELGIRVYTVGVGSAQGRPVPIVNAQGEITGIMKSDDGRTPLFSELDEGLLRQVATRTGGAYFHLGPEGLGDGLLKALDGLQKKEYDATFRALRDDRYQLAVWPALALLIIEALFAGRRRRRRRS